MKKLFWILGILVVAAGGLTAVAVVRVGANDDALEEVRGQKGVVVFDVSGMT